MSLATIKGAITAKLNALVDDEVLSYVEETDIKKNYLHSNIPSYPAAFVTPPSIESEVLDNRTVLRTYGFEVAVLFAGKDLESTTDLEERVEAILDAFDNDPTLGGLADGGMSPVASAPEPIQYDNDVLILVAFEIKARSTTSLSFG